MFFLGDEKMNIYLICGKAGSGKTKVANIIHQKIKKSVISNLSKYIKLFALEMTNWDGTDENKPRTFLQNMGDKLRAIDEYFLPKRMTEDIKIYQEYYDTLIISDVRLIKEIEYFKNNPRLNTKTIYVKSPKSYRNLTLQEQQHLTETELDTYNKFDYIIENDENNNLEEIIEKIIKDN